MAMTKLWLMKYTTRKVTAIPPATTRKYSETLSLRSARASWSASLEVRGRLDRARLKVSITPAKASRGLGGPCWLGGRDSSMGSASRARLRDATSPPKNSRIPTEAIAARMGFLTYYLKSWGEPSAQTRRRTPLRRILGGIPCIRAQFL